MNFKILSSFPLCFLPTVVQMIELYKNPSGETDVTTVATIGNNYLDSSTKGGSEDPAKVDQLKQTIQSLKRGIAEVS